MSSPCKHFSRILTLLILAGLVWGCTRQISKDEKEIRRDLRQALRARSYEQAEALARRVLDFDRRDNGAWERLAQAQLGRRDQQAAKSTLEEWARAVRRTSPKFHEYSGNIAAAENDPKRAAESWRATLLDQPKNKRVLEKLARLEQAERHWQESDAAWTALLAIEQSAHALVQRAICRRHLHRWTESAADLHGAREVAPGDPVVERWWTRSERLAKFVGAIRELDKQIAVSPKDAALLADRALLFLRSEEPDLALEDAELADKLAPWAVRPRLLHAAALLALGRETEAEKLLVQRTLRLEIFTPEFLETVSRVDAEISNERTNAELYVSRAWQLNEVGQPSLALTDAETAAKLDPKLASACAERSYALMKLGRTDEALEQITVATQLDANLGTAWQYRGELEMVRENFEAAVTSLSHAFAITQAPGALEKRAESYRRLGIVDKAEADRRTLQQLGTAPR